MQPGCLDAVVERLFQKAQDAHPLCQAGDFCESFLDKAFVHFPAVPQLAGMNAFPGLLGFPI